MSQSKFVDMDTYRKLIGEDDKDAREDDGDGDGGTPCLRGGGVRCSDTTTSSTPTKRTSDKSPLPEASGHTNGSQAPKPSPLSQFAIALPAPSLQQSEHATFMRMIKERSLRIARMLYTEPSNPLPLPIPWTPPAWSHALRYPDIVERYHELERRIDTHLRTRLFELRCQVVAYPGRDPVFASRSKELDRVIMRCRLADSVREYDAAHDIHPPRMPADTLALLTPPMLKEERKVKRVVEKKEKAVEEAIKILDEIRELAMEEENVAPIVGGFDRAFEGKIKRWPVLRERMDRAWELERKRFPKRFVGR